MDIVKVLQEGGFETVTGIDAVNKAISEVADISTTPLCSGYRVFPNGEKCSGCNDCEGKE